MRLLFLLCGILLLLAAPAAQAQQCTIAYMSCTANCQQEAQAMAGSGMSRLNKVTGIYACQSACKEELHSCESASNAGSGSGGDFTPAPMASAQPAISLKPSTFQNTCPQMFVSLPRPLLSGSCLRNDKSNTWAAYELRGIANEDGALRVVDDQISTFQKSCRDIKLAITPEAVILTAICKRISGQEIPAALPITGISNRDGELVAE